MKIRSVMNELPNDHGGGVGVDGNVTGSVGRSVFCAVSKIHNAILSSISRH